MPQPGISAIGGEIAAFEAAAANPANYVFNGTISSSPAPAYEGMDPYTSCDPSALEAQWGSDPEASKTSSGQTIPLSRLDCVVDPRSYVVEGVVRSAGSTTGALVTISSAAINAGTLDLPEGLTLPEFDQSIHHLIELDRWMRAVDVPEQRGVACVQRWDDQVRFGKPLLNFFVP